MADPLQMALEAKKKKGKPTEDVDTETTTDTSYTPDETKTPEEELAQGFEDSKLDVVINGEPLDPKSALSMLLADPALMAMAKDIIATQSTTEEQTEGAGDAGEMWDED